MCCKDIAELYVPDPKTNTLMLLCSQTSASRTATKAAPEGSSGGPGAPTSSLWPALHEDKDMSCGCNSKIPEHLASVKANAACPQKPLGLCIDVGNMWLRNQYHTAFNFVVDLPSAPRSILMKGHCQQARHGCLNHKAAASTQALPRRFNMLIFLSVWGFMQTDHHGYASPAKLLRQLLHVEHGLMTKPTSTSENLHRSSSSRQT